ncbi:MAG: hypothetical protein AAFY28_11160 [Actinomycetota bacterium]
MSDAPTGTSDGKKERWNTEANTAVEGDEYIFVAALNFVIRSFRRLRSRLRF